MIGEYRLPLLAVGMNATVFAVSSGSTRGSSRLTAFESREPWDSRSEQPGTTNQSWGMMVLTKRIASAGVSEGT